MGIAIEIMSYDEFMIALEYVCQNAECQKSIFCPRRSNERLECNQINSNDTK